MTYTLPFLFGLGGALLVIGYFGEHRSAAYCGVIGAMCIGAATLGSIGWAVWRLVS